MEVRFKDQMVSGEGEAHTDKTSSFHTVQCQIFFILRGEINTKMSKLSAKYSLLLRKKVVFMNTQSIIVCSDAGLHIYCFQSFDISFQIYHFNRVVVC